MASSGRSAFLFAALLISSLYSDGAYVQMAGVLLLLFFCLFFSSARAEIFGHGSLLIFAWSVCIVTGCYLYFLIFPNPLGSSDLEKAAFNNYLFFIILIIFVICVRGLIKTEIRLLTGSMAALIILNDLILFIQTAVLAVSKNYIDFVAPVTGEESRYHNYENLNPVFAFRPTGLYVEPSTFSAAVGAMAIGYVLLCRAQGRQANRWALLLTIMAMLITQSTAATIQCIILMFAVLLTQKKSVRIWSVVVCALLLLSAPAVMSTYYDAFVTKMDESSGIRISLLDYIYHIRSGWDLFFGYGPFSLEESLYHLTSTNNKYPVASLNDAGLLHYFVVRFGLVGLAIPLVMFLRMRKDLTSILFFALLLSSKLSYAFPVLYLGLLPLLMRLPVWSRHATVQDDTAGNRFEQPMPEAR